MLRLAGFLLLYFLPAIIGRHKRDAMGIFLLNLFLGWTAVGWVIALIWACAAESYQRAHVTPVNAGYKYCSQCGAIAYSGAHFCTACGRTV
jgi:Superinfection immunity protein